MVSVRVDLAFFMRYTTVDDEELVGADALNGCCEDIFNHEMEKPVEFSDLENPIKFSWVLEAATIAKVNKLRKDLLSKAHATLASVGSKGSSASNKKKGRRQRQQQLRFGSKCVFDARYIRASFCLGDFPGVGQEVAMIVAKDL